MESGSVVRAVFEFLPSVSEELPLFTGDVIEVLSVLDEFWLLGNKDGVTGQFPSTFVEEVTIPSTRPGDRLYVCISDFSSAEPGSLSLKRGDVVAGEAGGSLDLGQPWQRGCKAWGFHGLFPTSCVKELTLSGRSRQLSERSAQAQASELPPHALGQARALMSLHAQLHEELDFRQGDLIVITGRPEPGWFQGELEGRRGTFPEGFVELLGPLRTPQEPADRQYLNNDSEQGGYEDPYDTGEGTEEEAVEEEEEQKEEAVEEEEEEEAVEEEEEEKAVEEEEEQKEEAVEEEEEQKEEAEEEEEGGVYAVALYEFQALEAGELDFDAGDRIHVLSSLEDGWLEGRLGARRGVFPHRFVRLEGVGHKPADVVKPESSSGRPRPSGSEDHPERVLHKDHTVWDLDYFEQRSQTGAQRDGGHRPDSLTRTPAAPQRGPDTPKSTPPARPRLPSRFSPPARLHSNISPASGTNRSKYTNSSCRSFQSRLSHSQTLPSAQSGWSTDSRHYRSPPADGAAVRQGLLNLAQSQKKLTRPASVSGADALAGERETWRSQQVALHSNGFMPPSVASDSAAPSASDLEAKLSQQLFEFERSLTSSWGDTSSGSARDLSQLSRISRHFSISDYSDESDIIRGSQHAPFPQQSSASSSLERRRTLRPPPPRPKLHRPPAAPPYKPARPAPRRPPQDPRPHAAPPNSNSLSNIFYSPDGPAAVPDQLTGGQTEGGDLAVEQDQEVQRQLVREKELEKEMEMEREMEQENQRRREEEEKYQLLLRLQEVEHDMETYAHMAEELRTLLEEEEEEEEARMQAMENLEFCSYTLETLALEQQQLQGKTLGFKPLCCGGGFQ